MATSSFFRVWDVGHLPGVNGDEAWYGCRAEELLQGKLDVVSTPTGLPLNPFYLLPLAFFSSFVDEPNFIVLRSSALLCGFFLMLLSFLLMKSFLGKNPALLFTLLAATLPVHIAYSRFGWDASQSPLIALIALYFSLKGKGLFTLVCYGISVWVHPTNVFLLPILCGALFGKKILFQSIRFSRKFFFQLIFSSVFLVLLTLAMIPLIPDGKVDKVMDVNQIFERWTSLGLIWNAVIGYGRLTSGANTYQYIVGLLTPSELLIFDVLFWILFISLLFFGVRKIVKNREKENLGLVLGLFLSLALIYTFSGAQPFTPGYERYAMSLSIPTCYLITVFFVHTFSCGENGLLSQRKLKVSVVAICLIFLVSFHQNYFERFKQYGGHSHRTFYSNKVDCKQAALTFIKSENPDGLVMIAAEDWWSYWPIRYLASRDASVEVVYLNENLLKEILAKNYGREKAIYLVGFPNGNLSGYFNSQLSGESAGKIRESRKDFLGQTNQPIFHVWKVD